MKKFFIALLLLFLAGTARADVIIKDINNWKHPVKSIFINNNIVIQKIELKNSNTYPIFYVSFPANSKLKHEAYFEAFITDVAFANGFWDFEIMDDQKHFSVGVLMNKSDKKVKNVVYKNKKSYINTSTVIRMWRIDNILQKQFKNQSPNYLIQFDSLVDEDSKVYMLLHEWFKKDDGSFSTLGWYMLNSENGNLYKQNSSDNSLEFIRNVTNLQ